MVAKRPQQEAAIVRGVVYESRWTRLRANEAGYDISPMCPLCNEHQDTPHHRTWVCVKAKEAREKAELALLRTLANQALVTSTLFNKGIL